VNAFFAELERDHRTHAPYCRACQNDSN
jgi:hypothetical protein